MDYEQKYKSLIAEIKERMMLISAEKEKASSQVDKLSLGGRIAILQELLAFTHEFEESEDERIRKEIIQSIKDNMCVIHKEKCLAWLEKQKYEEWSLYDEDILDEVCIAVMIDNAFSEGKKKEIISWLQKYRPYMHEKQGEQNLNDKVEPKFKVGDWVVQGCNILKIRCVGDEYYCFETVGGYVDDMLVSEIDSLYHLWTIQDAKDGDILMARAPFIFNGNLGGGIDGPGAHCGINTLGKFQIPKNPEHWTGHTITPATKEQRDTLMKAMTDAGYTFDFEKKELRKIEQKASWSEEDEHCIELLLLIIDSSSLIPKNRKKCKEFLKSLKPNHWKPSEEQLTALKNAIIGKRGPLYDLYFDLEKL